MRHREELLLDKESASTLLSKVDRYRCVCCWSTITDTHPWAISGSRCSAEIEPTLLTEPRLWIPPSSSPLPRKLFS